MTAQGDSAFIERARPGLFRAFRGMRRDAIERCRGACPDRNAFPFLTAIMSVNGR